MSTVVSKTNVVFGSVKTHIFLVTLLNLRACLDKKVTCEIL